MTINQHTLASKMKSALKATGKNEIIIEGCEIWGPGIFDITYNTDDEMPAFYTYCKDMDTMGRGHSIWEAIEEMFCADDEIKNAFKEDNEEITVPDSEFEKLKSLLNETFDCGDEVFDAVYECANILKFVMTNSEDGTIRSKAARLFGIKRGTQKPYPEAVEDADAVADYLFEQSYEEYAQDIWDAFAQCRQSSLKEASIRIYNSAGRKIDMSTLKSMSEGKTLLVGVGNQLQGWNHAGAKDDYTFRVLEQGANELGLSFNYAYVKMSPSTYEEVKNRLPENTKLFEDYVDILKNDVRAAAVDTGLMNYIEYSYMSTPNLEVLEIFKNDLGEDHIICKYIEKLIRSYGKVNKLSNLFGVLGLERRWLYECYPKFRPIESILGFAGVNQLLNCLSSCDIEEIDKMIAEIKKEF